MTERNDHRTAAQPEREAVSGSALVYAIKGTIDRYEHAGETDTLKIAREIAALTTPAPAVLTEEIVAKIKAHVERYDTPCEDDPRRRYTIAQLEAAMLISSRLRGEG